MRWRSLSLSGLLIALIGFFLTRFTVTLAAGESTVQFLFAGILPLTLGLSLTAFGVILTVGAYDRQFVRTTALWCSLGTATMAVLVVMTVLGAQPDLMSPEELRQQTYLSNFLIGGAIGGTLTGLYAARNQRQRRELHQQANRLVLLNRLLRDQVINAATAIKGHSDVLSDRYNQKSVGVIDKQAGNVIDIIENVKYLSNTADRSAVSLGSVDLVACLENELADAREQYPDTEFDATLPDTNIAVRANAQLAEVFGQLLSNGAEYSDSGAATVSVSVETSANDATVTISDTGPGLPTDQQALLERGEIAEFDDPTTGFGLNIVRLLVESFDGEISTVVEDGTAVQIRLPRAGGTLSETETNRRAITAPGVSPSRLGLAVVASLLAGITMGGAMNAVGGDIPVIGALYGIKDPVVAFISHEFHSIVFGLVFAGIISAGPARMTGSLRKCLAVAFGLGVFLWLVAAGLIMPAWLRLVGIETPIPNLTLPSLIGHLVWALTLGTLYHYGDEWLSEQEFPNGGPAEFLSQWVR